MFCSSNLPLLLLYYNQSFLTRHGHSFCLARDTSVQCQKLVKVFQLRPCQCWTSWKHMDVSPSSTSMVVAHPCSRSDSLQASHPLKKCLCSPFCDLHLTIRSAISCTSFYRASPFFPQNVSLIHHNYFDTEFKNSLFQFTYFGNPFNKVNKCAVC